MSKTQQLYDKAKKMIPGATQLLSKRPEMFLPGFWPAYYKKANGCEIWDIDNKKYIDMSYMGIGACILGYADKDVDCAVKKAIEKGSMATLNCPEEVELADSLFKIHPWAHMARYARCGGEAMAVAVRIARAKRQKDIILFCGYHGWHDWYLSANLASNKSLDGHLLAGLAPRGVPRALRETAFPFAYNDTKTFLNLVKKYNNNIAAVVMEPIRNYYPKADFLETVRKVTQKLGLILIFDEVSSGWRLTLGGAHLLFNVYPDIAVFAKGISNGYPMAAIIGKSDVMDIAQETFISSTYWTERVGPTAALATIKKLKTKKVAAYLSEVGREIQSGWRYAARKNCLGITISGTPALSHFAFDYEGRLAAKTLFTQLMLKEGFLATDSFYASYAHKDKHIKAYLKAVGATFRFLASAIKKGNLEKHLKGSVCHSGFKRLA
ncbi:MAG: aminotransferase class III-fold pyridoxal phosphate-dependent enzyme [Candidatus Omnitrophota bacterium]